MVFSDVLISFKSTFQLVLLSYLSFDFVYCGRVGFPKHQNGGLLICGQDGQVHDIGAVFSQTQQGTESHPGRCPPAPDEFMPQACDVCMCWSDSQCGPDQKCCYNGCMQTCLHKVKPPPVLDWLIEPTRKPIVKGNAWLIPGNEIVDTEETCSTSVTPDGETPLPCPTGYICEIQDIGDPIEGVPNRGICVQE